MAYIVQQIVGDQQLQLANEELLWKFQFGTDWNFIRICLRYSFQMTSGAQSPGLLVGVNNGTTAGYFTAGGCPEYLGVTSANGYTFNSGTPNYFNYAPLTLHYKVGTTDLTSSATNSTCYGPTAPGRTLAFVDFKKRTAANQLTAFMCGYLTINKQLDITSMRAANTVMEALQGETTTDPNLFALSINYAYAGPYSFDSLSISNSGSAATLLISDVMVVRYY